jgi:hypothetical protein
MRNMMRPWRHLLILTAVLLSLSGGFSQAGFTDQTGVLAPTFGNGKASWGDFNNDGFADLINHDSGLVWTNLNGTAFTSNANGGSGGVMADYDNDGLLDIYYYGLNLLSRNFSTQVTTSFAYQSILPAVPMWDAVNTINRSNAACWADFNNDAHVDVYVGGYEIWQVVSAYYDAVLWNNQAASFTTSAADHYNLNPTRGVTACDWDRDGDQDIYASNYRLVANQLLRNNAGSFTNVAGSHNATGGSGHSIGSAWGDIDNDGDFDLFAGNFAHDADFFGPGDPLVRQPESRFLENLGPGASPPYSFDDKGTGGVTWQESYASPALGDYDNDGDLDLFFTTSDPGDHCRLYRNDGNWTFTDVTVAEGLSGLANTKQAAWADFNNDGDLDLATGGQIFVNNGNSNHWLKVHLTGDGTTVNRAAIGAEVRIDLGGGQILTRQVEGGTGEGNQNDLTLHFGLGSHSGTVDLEITAPGGTTQTISGVSVDQQVAYVVSVVPPEECGDAGTVYQLTDTNKDCYVNMKDFAQFSMEWLECTHPADPSCDP